MVYFIPNDIVNVALLSIFGYILSSIDLPRLFFTIKNKMNNKRNKVETTSNDDEFARLSSPSQQSTNKTNFKEKNVLEKNDDLIKEIIYHLVMIALTISCSMIFLNLITTLSSSIIFQIEIALLYTCIGLFIIINICSRLQAVYLFFGLIRNPLYPKYCMNEIVDNDYDLTINNRKKIFKIFKYIRICLLKFGNF
jgi:hypothetical protein